MTTHAARDARIAVLKREINSIHVANFAYWHRLDGSEPTRRARADYERRRIKLEAIRRELLDMATPGVPSYQ
jgi:hypothetical protein